MEGLLDTATTLENILTIGLLDINDLGILLADSFKIFGHKIMNTEDWVKMLWRFAINLVFVTLLVRGIYYPMSKRKDFLFSFFLVSSVTFLLCFNLRNTELDTGFALGLFAIFGILRYRTDTIPIREMTYLFVSIGLSAMNALIGKNVSYMEMITANAIIVAMAYLLERVWFVNHQLSKAVTYDNIDLIHDDKREELIADLSQRTGLDISKVVIEKIDYLRDTADITVFYVMKK